MSPGAVIASHCSLWFVLSLSKLLIFFTLVSWSNHGLILIAVLNVCDSFPCCSNFENLSWPAASHETESGQNRHCMTGFGFFHSISQNVRKTSIVILAFNYSGEKKWTILKTIKTSNQLKTVKKFKSVAEVQLSKIQLKAQRTGKKSALAAEVLRLDKLLV